VQAVVLRDPEVHEGGHAGLEGGTGRLDHLAEEGLAQLDVP
jgi:hypothetical protein